MDLTPRGEPLTRLRWVVAQVTNNVLPNKKKVHTVEQLNLYDL
jgi:hypothetical protein